MIPINIYGQSNYGISRDMNNTRCVNCFIEKDPENKNEISFVGVGGKRKVATLGAGPIRGAETFREHLYVVSGADVYKLDSDFNFEVVGSLETSSGRVGMDENGNQLAIGDGPNGYIWDDTTLQKITDVDFPGTDMFVFMDGYFIFPIADTGKAAISSAYDGLDYDGLDFKTAEKSPDNLQAIIQSSIYLFMLGNKTTEFWYNRGSRFPFQRAQNGAIDWGIIAKHSAAAGDNSVVWLSRNKDGESVIVQAYGPGTPKVISNRGMAHIFKEYSTVSDAYGFCYLQNSEYFYQITFPTANATWVYQFSNGQWFERERWDGGHDRASCHVYFEEARAHILGDFENGNLYVFDQDVYTDNCDRIRRLRESRIVASNGKRVIHHGMIQDVETGVGNNDDENPVISLRYSDDGRKWSNPSRRSMGEEGHYGEMPRWNRLGSAVNRRYQLEYTGKTKFRAGTTYLDLEETEVHS